MPSLLLNPPDPEVPEKAVRRRFTAELLFPKISGGLERLDLQNKWTDAIKGVAIAG
jgi:hypothetical protein